LRKSTFKAPSMWLCLSLLILFLFLPAVLQRFYTYILAVIFVTSLLAMSLNMVVGHGGLFQFHHGVFYGVGAYAFALMITKAGFPMWLAFIASPLVAAATGFLIGWFCVRLTSLYFGMLQISLGSLIWALAFRWYSLTNGDDGIHGIPVPDVISSTTSSYYFIFLFFVLGILVMYVIHMSPFGTTMQAIRDNPARCSAIGINVRRHQLLAIVIAAFFAGVAGVLFVVLERSVFPDLLFWVLSLEIFIMCLLGGWFTFLGPVVGAAITVSLRTFVGVYTEYWTFILGILLILLIFFLPEGVMGFFTRKFRKGRGQEAASARGLHAES
jgi:branched-chain amino acid transport system permease protein